MITSHMTVSLIIQSLIITMITTHIATPTQATTKLIAIVFTLTTLQITHTTKTTPTQTPTQVMWMTMLCIASMTPIRTMMHPTTRDPMSLTIPATLPIIPTTPTMPKEVQCLTHQLASLPFLQASVSLSSLSVSPRKALKSENAYHYLNLGIDPEDLITVSFLTTKEHEYLLRITIATFQECTTSSY